MAEENLLTDLSIKTEINLYYDLFIPENIQKNAPLLVAVHGYGAHKRYMMREARAVAPKDFVIVSLQAPYQHFRKTDDGFRIGFGWLTDYKNDESILLHHNFLLEIIERLAAQNLINANKIFLYGFSQACALNFRFALTFPDIPRGVIGVCGGVPSDLETNPNYRPTEAETFYIYNDDDEFYPIEKYESYASKLYSYLPNVKAKIYNAKHEITEPMREDIKFWLKEKNEKFS